MLQRVFTLLSLFLFPVMVSAQIPADSVGTIYVRKKEVLPPDTIAKSAAIYFIVDQMPGFPNNGMTMSEFIDATFIVPKQAIDRGVSGTIWISCLVDADGELKNARVARGLPACPDCNTEALRVVSQMPLWIPGRQNGKAVPVMVSIPVRFRFNQ